jgi:hypothetical protein
MFRITKLSYKGQGKVSFYVDIRWMHGDADFYTVTTLPIGDSEEEVIRFVTCIEWIRVKHPTCRHESRWGQLCVLRDAPDYLTFFTSLDRDESVEGFRTYEERLERLRRGWGEEYLERDKSGFNGLAKIDSYAIFWNDTKGVPFAIEVHDEHGNCIVREKRWQ